MKKVTTSLNCLLCLFTYRLRNKMLIYLVFTYIYMSIKYINWKSLLHRRVYDFVFPRQVLHKDYYLITHWNKRFWSGGSCCHQRNFKLTILCGELYQWVSSSSFKRRDAAEISHQRITYRKSRETLLFVCRLSV